MTTYRIGDRVRCQREAPPKGTWKEFAGRVGTVTGTNLGEIGVRLDDCDRIEWFQTNEIVRVK